MATGEDKREGPRWPCLYEELVVKLPFVFRNPRFFQMTECVSRIWKAYMESVYTINHVFSTIWKALLRDTSCACQLIVCVGKEVALTMASSQTIAYSATQWLSDRK